nr:hypothetical protein [Tanacetum cinerariifolium]
MALTFADTHNMIAYLTKSDASEGFNQIINFLNASLIKYALTVNPNIYVSCIKQFCTSVSVKKGIDYLPNEEIFTELARMWGQVGDLSSHAIKYSSPALTQKVFANMRRVGKGFYRVDTPLFEGMLVAQQVDESAAELNVDDVHVVGVADEVQTTSPPSPIAQPPSPQQQPQPSQDAKILMDLLHNLLDTCTTLTRRVKHLEQEKIAQVLEITKLKQRVKKLERRNKLKERMIADMDANVDFTLKDVADIAKEVVVDPEVKESAYVQGRQAESQAQIYQIDLKRADKVLSIVIITVAAPQLTTAAAPHLTTAASPILTTAPSAARRRKGVVIRDLEETITPSTIIHYEAKSKDKGKGILVEKPKPLKKKAQIKQDEAYARELEAELNNNIDWDETKEQMEEEDSRALKRLNESQEDKAAKKQKLDKEVAELKRHLQIVPNDEDNGYTKATPLARKVPVVDYEIYTENNKPYYKITRADGSPQLFLNFLSLLRNFNREDLEVLWELVKESITSECSGQFGEGAAEVNVKDVSTACIAAEGAASDDEVSAVVDEPSIPSPPSPTQPPPPPPSQDIPSTSQIAQALEITKLKQRVKKLERRNKASKLKRLKKVGTSQRIETSDDTVMDDVSKQGMMIADMDADVDVTLKDVDAIVKDVQDAEIKESLDVHGRQAESQAQIYQIDLEHTDKVLSMQDVDIEPAELQEVVEVVTTAKLITEVVTAASATITAAAPQLTTVAAPTLTTAPTKSKDKGKGIMVEEPKPLKKQAQIEQDEAYARELERYQALKRKPQTKAQARKNMMIYLRNMAGFKMDYFKGMPYDDIRPIFEKKFNSNVAFLLKTKEQMDAEDSRALKRLSESQEDNASKKQR